MNSEVINADKSKSARSIKYDKDHLPSEVIEVGIIAIDCKPEIKETFAINCTNAGNRFEVISVEAQRFIHQSLSLSTKRAYRADLADYEATGRSIPSTSEEITDYIASLAGRFAVATIERRLASLSKAHRALGENNPVRSELVRATLKGIRRTYGAAQRQAKPILRDDLVAMLDRLGPRPKDVRDRALLLVGFAGGFRRSELIALDMADVEFTPKGMLITIRRSKTDQEGRGRQIAVPFGRSRHCPVSALKAWLGLLDRENGAIFPVIDRHGHIGVRRISGEAVNVILKKRLQAAGYDQKGFSGHSLRSGFVTSAAMAGASSFKIRETTGHKSEAMVVRYTRSVDLFEDTAIGRVL